MTPENTPANDNACKQNGKRDTYEQAVVKGARAGCDAGSSKHLFGVVAADAPCKFIRRSASLITTAFSDHVPVTRSDH